MSYDENLKNSAKTENNKLIDIKKDTKIESKEDIKARNQKSPLLGKFLFFALTIFY